MKVGRTALLLLVLGLSCFGEAAERTEARQPAATNRYGSQVDLSAYSNIDENLLALRILNQLEDEWPTAFADKSKLTQDLAKFRHQLNRHLFFFKDQKLDQAVIDLYGEFISLTDAYGTLLEELGKIQRDNRTREDRDTLEEVIRSAASGGSDGTALNASGASDSTALIGAAIAGACSMLFDEIERATKRETAKKSAMEASIKRFQDLVSTFEANVEATAHSLTVQFGWNDGEPGFDTSDEDAERIRLMASKKDFVGLAEAAREQVRRRPRDPFALMESVSFDFLAAGPSINPGTEFDFAKRCFEATELIPSGNFYNSYRNKMILAAEGLLISAVDDESCIKGFQGVSRELVEYATRIWSNYLVLDAVDLSGMAREELAWLTACRGDYTNALTKADEIYCMRQNDGTFHFNYARVTSLSGGTSNAVYHLEKAFGLRLHECFRDED